MYTRKHVKNSKQKNNVSPSLTICQKTNETIIRVFYCKNVIKIWKTSDAIINKLNTNAENNTSQNNSSLNIINTEKNTKKIRMTISTSILNEIWKPQNLFKHE